MEGSGAGSGSGSVLVTNGSGCVSGRPKNIQIRRSTTLISSSAEVDKWVRRYTHHECLLPGWPRTEVTPYSWNKYLHPRGGGFTFNDLMGGEGGGIVEKERSCWNQKISFGGQCGGSGMFIPDPWSRIPDPGSLIPDPGSRIQKQQQKRGLKKKLLSYLFL